MLRISNRGQYAIRALLDLAFHHGVGPNAEASAPVKDVAARQRIPLRFLEQIFQALKRAGLVASKRGPRGGVRLAKDPQDVRLGDVIRAVDGPVALAPPRRASRRATDLRDLTDEVLAEVSRSVERCFDGVTLGDLCARGEALGLHEKSQGPTPLRWVI